MEPGKTSFFQALGVPTKIARGTIEITADVKVAEAGSRVGASEATLLNMLNVSPFTYGMSIAQIYDQGQTFDSSVLDIEERQLLKAFTSAIATIATISLAINYPTLPSVMHSLVNSYKNVISAAIEIDPSPVVEAIERRTGLSVRIIAGEEEARLSALGVLSGTPGADGLMGDLGGGSLELVGMDRGVIGPQVTMPLGPLRLLESCGGKMSAAARIIDQISRSAVARAALAWELHHPIGTPERGAGNERSEVEHRPQEERRVLRRRASRDEGTGGGTEGRGPPRREGR